MDAQILGMPVTDSAIGWKRGFWSVWATQFQESFSDNAYRWIVVTIVTEAAISEATRSTLNLVAGILFAAPFVLFSPLGGYLADRFSKRQITIWTKWMEVGSMVIATIGLAKHSLPISLAALTLVAIILPFLTS